ncbi:MAG: NAD(P)/FAD-dependent oxidoreductase [Candidatus Odinarchaeota archaeon]|nr:NAD(P)/FAD-dependent oxidoreductase [Candidatus Odinarchaeota archaeon]
MLNGNICERTDIAIVGAGPAGLVAATCAARTGVKVSVFEEHGIIGLPTHCAGLVSIRGFKKLGFYPPSNVVLNKVRGAIFFSPSGHSFVVEGKKDQAYVLDRILYDQFLALKAEKAGAKIELACKVNDVFVNRNKVFIELVKGKREKIVTTKVLIDAEGVKSVISSRLGFSKPQSLLPAVQFEMENVEVYRDFVELYFGQKIAPGFFAWIIPTSDSSARVGLAAKSKPLNLLKKFLRSNKQVLNRFRKGKIVRVIGGTVITGGPISRTWDSRVLLVGDVAGQVKPTTGGGIVLGSLCSIIAGRVAGEFVRNDLPVSFLSNYEKTWRKLFGREFRSMKILRTLLNFLSDKTLDKLFLYISRYEFNEDLAKYGDMDFQYKTILRSLSNIKALAVAFLTLLSQLV